MPAAAGFCRQARPKLDFSAGAYFAALSATVFSSFSADRRGRGAPRGPCLWRATRAGGWTRIVINVPDVKGEVDGLRRGRRPDITAGPGGKEICSTSSGNPVELFSRAHRQAAVGRVLDKPLRRRLNEARRTTCSRRSGNGTWPSSTRLSCRPRSKDRWTGRALWTGRRLSISPSRRRIGSAVPFGLRPAPAAGRQRHPAALAVIPRGPGAGLSDPSTEPTARLMFAAIHEAADAVADGADRGPPGCAADPARRALAP